ncbi:MEDS domain-containing protein [Pseudonocardia bannensis]
MLDVGSSAAPSHTRKDSAPDELPGMWEVIVDSGRSGGTRLGAEASCWLPRAGQDSLIRYENEVARYIPEQLVVLCLYDLNRFGAGVLIDAIRMHPQVIVGAQVIQNPYYRSPEQFVAAHPGPVRSADPTPAQDEMAEAGVGSSARSGPGRAGRPDPTVPGWSRRTTGC